MSPIRPLLLGAFALAVLSGSVGCGGSGTDTPDTTASRVDDNATATFSTDSWEPSWTGTLRAGGRLNVSYDFGRLPECRNANKITSWVVELSYRFDEGPISTVALPGSPGASETLSAAGVHVPSDAKSVEMWFENRAVGGYDDCEAWDSRYGANYTHTIEP